jgi:hypothetical protein
MFFGELKVLGIVTSAMLTKVALIFATVSGKAASSSYLIFHYTWKLYTVRTVFSQGNKGQLLVFLTQNCRNFAS